MTGVRIAESHGAIKNVSLREGPVRIEGMGVSIYRVIPCISSRKWAVSMCYFIFQGCIFKTGVKY